MREKIQAEEVIASFCLSENKTPQSVIDCHTLWSLLLFFRFFFCKFFLVCL